MTFSVSFFLSRSLFFSQQGGLGWGEKGYGLCVRVSKSVKTWSGVDGRRALRNKTGKREYQKKGATVTKDHGIGFSGFSGHGKVRVGAATQPIVVLFDGQIHFLFLFILPSPFSGVLFISIAFSKFCFQRKRKEEKNPILSTSCLQSKIGHCYSREAFLCLMMLIATALRAT